MKPITNKIAVRIDSRSKLIPTSGKRSKAPSKVIIRKGY